MLIDIDIKVNIDQHWPQLPVNVDRHRYKGQHRSILTFMLTSTLINIDLHVDINIDQHWPSCGHQHRSTLTFTLTSILMFVLRRQVWLQRYCGCNTHSLLNTGWSIGNSLKRSYYGDFSFLIGIDICAVPSVCAMTAFCSVNGIQPSNNHYLSCSTVVYKLHPQFVVFHW